MPHTVQFAALPSLYKHRDPLYWLYPCWEEHCSGSQLHLRHTPISGGVGGWGRGGILDVLADKLCHSCSITLLPTALVSLSLGCFLHGGNATESGYMSGFKAGKQAEDFITENLQVNMM